MSDLTGKVAIVTGASVGLGKSMAIALARGGARVVLASPQTTLLQEVAQQINAAHGGSRALAVTTDITVRSAQSTFSSTMRAASSAGRAFPQLATACRSGSPTRMSGYRR
jgi:NAD(P)-dependent dehydrogenase (short-subunit alcohol dehydrogenase family)